MQAQLTIPHRESKNRRTWREMRRLLVYIVAFIALSGHQ